VVSQSEDREGGSVSNFAALRGLADELSIEATSFRCWPRTAMPKQSSHVRFWVKSGSHCRLQDDRFLDPDCVNLTDAMIPC